MEYRLLTDDIIFVAIALNLFMSITMFIIGKVYCGNCCENSKYVCYGMAIAHLANCIFWACLFTIPTVSENSEALIRLFIDI